MKKVLFVHDGPIYKDEYGRFYGIDYNTKLKERYLKLGDNVSFLMRVNNLSKLNNKKVSEIESSNFRAIEVPNFKSPIKYLKNKRIAEKIIEKAVIEHDVLVIRLPSSIGISAFKYAKMHNKKYIIEMVACAWDGYVYHSNLGKIIAPYMFLKTKSIVAQATHCIYVSQQFLQERYPCYGKTIGISDVILPSVSSEVLTNRINRINKTSIEEKVVIGTAAAVNMKYKGHKYVIKAISRLNKKGYNFEYQLVGGGDRTYLTSIAKKYNVTKNVKFLGAKSHNEVLEWMDNLDIYIQPSLAEAHGRVLIEAMSRACMCIGSNAGGIPELVKQEYIFRKSKTYEIYKLLENINKDNLRYEAKYNFEKSKLYNANELNKIRERFFEDFLDGDKND